ncbi:MAG: hypothetical protein K2M82_04590 [Lachnospiraceae bacterium]|nr:hypothetical protein [Lachnospiraceae bacterium]
MEELNEKIETEKCSEEEDQFEKEFEEERFARNGLTLVMLLTSVFTILYHIIDRCLVVGAACVYLNTAVSFLIVATNIVYVIFFFAVIRKMETYRGVYVLWIVMAVLGIVSSTVDAVNYVKDMTGGTKTQQIEVYYAGENYITFTDENGESVRLDITQKLIDEINEKCPIDADADYVSLDTNSSRRVKPRKNSITVEYFPNTETLSKIIF